MWDQDDEVVPDFLFWREFRDLREDWNENVGPEGPWFKACPCGCGSYLPTLLRRKLRGRSGKGQVP